MPHFKVEMSRFKVEMLRFKAEMSRFKVEMSRFKVELSRFGLEKTKKRQKLCFFMQPTHNNYRLCGIISFYYPQSIL